MACHELLAVSHALIRTANLNERSGRARFGFAVTDHAGCNQIWVVHDGAKGHGESVTQLSTLVDRPRRFGVDVTASSQSCRKTRRLRQNDQPGESCRCAKRRDQLVETLRIA